MTSLFRSSFSLNVNTAFWDVLRHKAEGPLHVFSFSVFFSTLCLGVLGLGIIPAIVG